MAKTIHIAENQAVRVATGTAGLRTQIPRAMTSVSSLAEATGGIRPDGFIKTDTK